MSDSLPIRDGLLKLDDVAFLKALVKRYPEMNMLSGPTAASPEDDQKRETLAHQVFDETGRNHGK